jgi:hypothetical protein
MTYEYARMELNAIGSEKRHIPRLVVSRLGFARVCRELDTDDDELLGGKGIFAGVARHCRRAAVRVLQ